MKLRGYLSFALVGCLVLVACNGGREPEEGSVRSRMYHALEIIGLDKNALSVPKLGMPYSTPGRLAVVDTAMKDPLFLQDMAGRLLYIEEKVPISGRVDQLVKELQFSGLNNRKSNLAGKHADYGAGTELVDMAALGPELQTAVKLLLDGIERAAQVYAESGGTPAMKELSGIEQHLVRSIEYKGLDPEAHWLMPVAYHRLGARINIDQFTSLAVSLLAIVDEAVSILGRASQDGLPFEWTSPLGRVIISGSGDDTYSGDYLLLIDLAGNDRYENVGRKPRPGQISIVIDMEGDDEVQWETVPGPGAGVMGVGMWVDVSGNDVYRGSNMGLGTGLLGLGVFWDKEGDDSYYGRAMLQGAGQYGVGIMIDEAGDDRYNSGMAAQGFGGPGGLGLQLDMAGDDQYVCGGEFPDHDEARARRHKAEHFLGMCQGYAYGIRPEVSGGVGLLLDISGDDNFTADMFAQGGALWFGLGMLVDGHGNDVYKAFEHAQGASLHLGAGFLGDFQGDDSYEGYEHCQGVGIDRAAGYLYDHAGDDSYVSDHESQAAGLKPYGVGILVDAGGNDRLSASSTSQGYSVRPAKKFPETQWPLGIMLNIGGVDLFEQPGVAPPDAGGRIINRQGIALKY